MDFFFVQETHSTTKNDNALVNDFNGPVFFSHGTLTPAVIYLLTLVKHPLPLTNRKPIKLEES